MPVFADVFLDLCDVDDRFTCMDQLIQDLPSAATSIQYAWGFLLAGSVLALTWMSMKLLTNVVKVGVLAGLVYLLMTPVPELQGKVDHAISLAKQEIVKMVDVDAVLPTISDIASERLLAREDSTETQALNLPK